MLCYILTQIEAAFIILCLLNKCEVIVYLIGKASLSAELGSLRRERMCL